MDKRDIVMKRGFWLAKRDFGPHPVIRGVRSAAAGGTAYVLIGPRDALGVDGGMLLCLPPLQPGEVRHSPTGFEWGYDGSGPSELARAILDLVGRETLFTRLDELRRPGCYRKFKHDVVARQPREGFELPFIDVMEWIREYFASLDASGVDHAV